MNQRFQQCVSSLNAWVVLGVVSVMSSPVWAQVEELRPPKTSASPSSPKFIMYGIVVVLVACAVVVVTLKAKRDHQD